MIKSQNLPNFILLLASFMVCILLILALISCRKDEPSNVSTDAYRLKEYSFFNDGVLSGKVVVDYSEDRITAIHQFEILNTDTIMREDFRILIEYPSPNKAVKTYYSFENQNWVILSKVELYYHKELIDSCLGYNYSGSDWEVVNKFTRQYDGGKISKNILYNFYSNWRPYIEQDFHYTGDRLSSIINKGYHGTNDWQEVSRYTLNYTGSKILEIVTSGYENDLWLDMKKSVFEYIGSHVSKIEEFLFSEGSWSPDSYTYYYTYNTVGNLSTMINISPLSKLKLEYTYENAKGNWFIINDTNGDNWLYYYTTPTPTKASPATLNQFLRLFQGLDFFSQGELKQ